MGLFVHLSGCNKRAQAGWFTNNRNAFLTVQEAGSQSARRKDGQILTRPTAGTFPLCPLMTEGAGSSLEPLLKGHQPHLRECHPMKQAPLKGPISWYHHLWRLGFQNINRRGNIHSDHSRCKRKGLSGRMLGA